MENLEQIARQLVNPNRVIRYRAVYSLSKIDHPEAFDLLVQTLREDADTELRAMAAKLIGNFPDQQPVPPLLEALERDPHAPVRRAAAETLGFLDVDDQAVIEAMAAALYDRSKHVRRAVLQTLQLWESHDAVPSLIGVLLGDKDGYVRWEAAKTLQALLPPQARYAFVEALSADENSYVRYAAAISLGYYDDLGEVVPPLLQALLEDENSYVRYAAGKSLGHLMRRTEDARFVGWVLPALNDSNTHVWHVVAESLWEMAEIAFPAVLESLVNPDPAQRRVALKAVLWLSLEFDDELLLDMSDPGDETTWGWWN